MALNETLPVPAHRYEGREIHQKDVHVPTCWRAAQMREVERACVFLDMYILKHSCMNRYVRML